MRPVHRSQLAAVVGDHISAPAPPRLLVSGRVAGRVSLLNGTERAEVNHRPLAMPDGLVVCVDDWAGELLVLDPEAAR